MPQQTDPTDWPSQQSILMRDKISEEDSNLPGSAKRDSQLDGKFSGRNSASEINTLNK